MRSSGVMPGVRGRECHETPHKKTALLVLGCQLPPGQGNYFAWAAEREFPALLVICGLARKIIIFWKKLFLSRLGVILFSLSSPGSCPKANQGQPYEKGNLFSAGLQRRL